MRQRILAAAPAALLAALAVPAGAAAATAAPTISGVPQVGETLTVSLAGLDAPRPHGRLLLWKRCDASGERCRTLQVRGLQYTLGDDDAYHTIRVKLVSLGHWGHVVQRLSDPTEVVLTAQATGPRELFEGFDGPDGLVTNDYAYRNPEAADAVTSPDWFMTNGSLFQRAGVGWSGVPDNGVTDATSSTATHSASFRLISRRGDLENDMVSARLDRLALGSTSSTPSVAWDGLHVVLRWQSLESFYAVSVDRRDGLVAIKKKVEGGPSYGGTYTTLAWRSAPVSGWQAVKAVAHTNDDGSVTLGLFRDDHLVLSVTDRGAGGEPPLGAGHVGLYGDNAEFDLDDLAVDAL